MLTQREQEVMGLIVEGLCNKAIAARLHIALHTVKCHVHVILEKLALGTRLEVAALPNGNRGKAWRLPSGLVNKGCCRQTGRTNSVERTRSLEGGKVA